MIWKDSCTNPLSLFYFQDYFLLQLGSKFEDEIFEGLLIALKRGKIQNTVVLSGLYLNDDTVNKVGEFDFFVISSASKSIIQIEAIVRNNNSNRKSASKQLKRGQTLFEENVPFPISENWNYTKMMCFGDSVKNDICDQCKPFILCTNFQKEETVQSVSGEIADHFLSILSTTIDVKNNGKD